jgi:dinuclear metal center YbgI/SA1388 family protein
MTKIRDIYNFIGTKAPWDTKLSFDNVGMLVGDAERGVTRVLTALDITPEVIAEAAECGAELIVSHHPVIFINALTSVTAQSAPEVLALAEHKIAAICAHTNLDAAPEGVNFHLAKRLGLVEPYEAVASDGVGRIANLPHPVKMQDFLKTVSAELKTPVRFYDSGNAVSRVAVCGGSGGDYASADEIARHGFDTLVTADIKHGQWLTAVKLGLNLIDADHFATENVIVPVLCGWLSEAFPNLEVKVSERYGQTVKFFTGE